MASTIRIFASQLTLKFQISKKTQTEGSQMNHDQSLLSRIERLEGLVGGSKIENSKPEAKIKTVHKFIICDGCKMEPIVGKRFKCTVLSDYDLCEVCEAKSNHPHPMIRYNNEAPRSFGNGNPLKKELCGLRKAFRRLRGLKKGTCLEKTDKTGPNLEYSRLNS